jgi:hypothetical protein
MLLGVDKEFSRVVWLVRLVLILDELLGLQLGMQRGRQPAVPSKGGIPPPSVCLSAYKTFQSSGKDIAVPSKGRVSIQHQWR